MQSALGNKHGRGRSRQRFVWSFAALSLVSCIGDDEPEAPITGAGGTGVDASAGQSGQGPLEPGDSGRVVAVGDASAPVADAERDGGDAAPEGSDAEVSGDASRVWAASTDAP